MARLTPALLALGIGTSAVGAADLDVFVGEPFTISASRGYHWFPTLKQISPERLLAAIWCSYDEISPETARTAFCATDDAGATWSAPVPEADAGHSWARLADGSCLWLSYMTMRASDAIASCRVGRSIDGLDYHWSTGAVDFSPMRVPHLTKGAARMLFARSILTMPDGSLLATMYGRFVDDTRDRSIVVRSTDGGSRWRYLSTIGYLSDIGGEGLNEPCIAATSSGDLVAIMRNASGEPMWTARSTDAGKSWSDPRPIPTARGVFPDIIRMSSGLLACSFGRPGCKLMFSADDGASWSDPVPVFDGPSTYYTAIREVEPGKLLYIHDVIPGGWKNELAEGQQNEIRGVHITVAAR